MVNLFKKNVAYLKEKKAVNYDDIGFALNCSANTISYWVNKDFEPKMSQLEKMAQYFEITLQELLYEDLSNVHLNKKEDIKKSEENVHLNVHQRVHLNVEKGQLEPKPIIVREPTYLATPQGQNITQIPITDISVAAGTGVFNNDYIENMDFFGFPNHLLKPGRTYLSVRIKGASMAPTLQDGGYMAIRLIEKGEWAKLRDERIYVVSDIDGKSCLKRVKNRFKQGFIVLMSDSPDKATYPSFNLLTNEIVSIWEAEFYISAKMPNIHAQYYTRLQELEDKVDDILKKGSK